MLNDWGSEPSEVLLESDQRCEIYKRTTVANFKEKEYRIEFEKKMDQKTHGSFVNLQQENLQQLQKQKHYSGRQSASCSSETKLKKIFERHLDKHSGKVLFKCLYCQFQSTYLKDMMGHINSTHQTGSEMVPCDRQIYPKVTIQERICGLCLKVCDNFKAVEGNLKDVLDAVLPKIDLSAIQELVLCAHCTETLIECSAFKTTCLNAYNYTVSFANNRDDVKLNLRDVYLSKNDVIAEDQAICGFCMNPIRNCSAISLDVEERGVLLEKMMEKCLPELDLSLIKKPVICATCHGSLKNCFHFVMNCLLVEERIKKICETVDVKSRNRIELSHLLEFMARDATASEVNGNTIDIIKEEKQLCKEREKADGKNSDIEGGLIKSEQMFCGDSENVTEGENKKLDETDTYVKEENVSEVRNQECLIKEEIEIKTDETDFTRVEEGIVLPQLKVTTSNQWKEEDGWFKCNSCSYKAERKDSIQCHQLVHKNSSEVTMYKCSSCPFQTKRKLSLKHHFLVHEDPSEITMYKCDSCSFQAKRKGNLKEHVLLHKNPSEIAMYKCASCPFQTKYKKSLINHLKIHKSPSEITIYKCDFCSHQTKCRNSLKIHLLLHDSKEKTYKCGLCLFETTQKRYLRKHSLIHRGIIYKCATCSYQARKKSSLRLHQVVHNNPSKVTKYKCDSCSYKAKYKDDLIRHIKVHKEVIVYKCDTCSFQTKLKSYLKEHVLLHKNPSEVTTYKCGTCSFETKLKRSLTCHLLTHKNPSDLIMYKCDSCAFQTKHKHNLTQHLRIHQDSSNVGTYKCGYCSFWTRYEHAQVTVYKCDFCSYQGERHSNFHRHLLVHTNSSEVTMYKCDICPFSSMRKDRLEVHLLSHNKPPEITILHNDGLSYFNKRKRATIKENDPNLFQN